MKVVVVDEGDDSFVLESFVEIAGESVASVDASEA
jgi:hypothetical protein